jgi:hypothetical protein
MSEAAGALSRLIRYIPRWPPVYFEKTRRSVLVADTITARLIIKNDKPRPILIRRIDVEWPVSYAVSELELNGHMWANKLIRGFEDPIYKEIEPNGDLRASITFDPKDGIGVRISWRSLGLRSWPGVPISVRRSRQSLYEQYWDQLTPAMKGERDDWYGNF